MAFEKDLPVWHEAGSEVPERIKNNGWNPEDKPAAQHLNNVFHKTYEVLKELQENAAEKDVVNQQLAQTEEIFNQQLSNLDNQKAGKNEVNTLATNKADKSYVDTQLSKTMTQTEFDSWVATLLDGGPSIFFDTLLALNTAYPNGSSGVALVRETNPAKIYVWDGIKWGDFGDYQGIELKDEAVNLNNINDDVSYWNGQSVYASPTADPIIFIEKVFDLNDILADVTNVQSSYWSDFDYRISESNILKISTRAFLNNDPSLGVITPIKFYDTAQIDPVLNKTSHYRFGTKFSNVEGNRYVHLMIRLHVNDKDKFTEAFVKNLTLTVEDAPISEVGTGYKLYGQAVGSVLENIDVAPFNIPKLNDIKLAISEMATGIATEILTEEIPNYLKTRWYGKKSNWLGDSITAGVGTSNEQYRYYERVKSMLQLSVVRNYGISGTRIAPQSGNTTEATAFVNRFNNMDNDADLIIVFGGTNDYWSGTALLGTENSTNNAEFYGALNNLIVGLQNKYVGKEIIFITPYSQQWTGKTSDTANVTSGATMRDYVDAIKKRCGYYGIPVLDLFNTGGMDAAHNNNHKTYFVPDGVHPNDVGNQRIADRLVGLLKTL